MKGVNLGIIVICIFYLSGCNASNRISYWKTQDTYVRKHNKILVAGIVQDSLFRRQMEDHFTSDLRDLGYVSTSALNQFGLKGLSKLNQEETYGKLCENGIDGVIIFVLVDESKEESNKARRFKVNDNSFYYKRIWNYINIQSEQLYIANDESKTPVFWETVFFDLRTLEPLYVARTKSFAFHSAESLAHEYGKMIVKSMLKNKILFRHRIALAGPVKS